MNWQFSERASGFGANIFNILNEKRELLLKKGRKVYNFSVGTPDFPPDEHVMRAVAEAAADPALYKYSLGDLPELTRAVQDWYLHRYGVTLSADGIASVYGSQEGIAHIALVLCDPGDTVLVPDPGYPIFGIGPSLMGAKPVAYALDPETGWLPDLDGIDPDVARRAKMMLVSYPANPICRTAPRAFYERLVAFARKYQLLIVHDNAYSEILYDGREGFSFLSVPGAADVGVEFNSLSKSYNLTGLRISFLVGNPEIVSRFRTVRSQFDYGMSYLCQRAAIAALTGPQDSVAAHRAEYERRRDALCGGLRRIGWEVPDSEGTMFVWAPIPDGYRPADGGDRSVAFVSELLERTGVLCTPGSSFGKKGGDHVRFALVLPVPEIEAAVAAVRDSGILEA